VIRRTLSLLAPVLVLSLSACITVNIGQRDVVPPFDGAQPAGAPLSAAAIPGAQVAAGTVPFASGEIHYVLAKADPARPLVVFCGGNMFRESAGGASRGAVLGRFGDVLMFDYPGRGQSTGAPTRQAFEAARAPLARKIEALAAQRTGGVIFWGHSLGGTYCAALAAETKVASSLVMEGSFASIEDIADAMAGAARPLVRLRIDPGAMNYKAPELLKAYPGRIVVAASRQDETIPFKASRRLAARLEAQGRAVTFVPLTQGKHSRFYLEPAYGPAMTAAIAAP